MTDSDKQTADRIAALYSDQPWDDWDNLRELVDAHTGGDYDCVSLDILTDMVALRIRINGEAA